MDYAECLRYFQAVVESGGFTRASEMLGVDTAAVSRAVGSLEQRLGARLLQRSTRQLSVTEAGQRLYERVSPLLERLDTLETDTRGHNQEPTGVLRVVAHTSATLAFLVPLLAGFEKKYSKIKLDITLTEWPVDLVAQGFDLGITTPIMLTGERAVTKLLESIPRLLVASPAYLEKHGTPRHPSTLGAHNFIVMSPTPLHSSLAFEIDGEVSSVDVHSEISSNNPMFIKSMVLEGFGLGVIAKVVVEDELRNGALQVVLPDFKLVGNTVELLLAHGNRTPVPEKVKAFVEFASTFVRT